MFGQRWLRFMNGNKVDTKQLQNDEQQVREMVLALAKRYEGDCLSLLSLLRTIEALHREIREEMFQPTLPDSRRNLYTLLKEIEETGGWPYIERLKLRALLINFFPEEATNDENPTP